MPRTRSSQSTPRLTREATRLVTLALALNSSGSRVEDTYWEDQIKAAIAKLLRSGHDSTLETALDHLSQKQPGAYEVLVEQAETLTESTVIEKNGAAYDVLLVVAPMVAWTRYTIPTGPIAPNMLQAVVAQLHGHVLAEGARLALLPALVSIDQMPRTFSETWHWLQRLGSQALGSETTKPVLNEEAEMANMLADTRYIVGAVAVPRGAPIFRWQENPGEAGVTRETCLADWAAQIQPTAAALLPGCGFDCLLPDAYYVSNREADRRVRPFAVRAAVHWMEGALNIEPAQLRAVLAGCGEAHLDEYRIGFTTRNSNEVIYGCVWPLYGREDEPSAEEERLDPADEIAALLKELGVTELRRIPGILQADYCEDCGAPYFPDPLGELVHAELPEDTDAAPTQFH
jgi:hypothetical protein